MLDKSRLRNYCDMYADTLLCLVGYGQKLVSEGRAIQDNSLLVG